MNHGHQVTVVGHYSVQNSTASQCTGTQNSDADPNFWKISAPPTDAVKTVAEVWRGCNQVLVTDLSCHKCTEHTNVQQTGPSSVSLPFRFSPS
jgi:hypothetical protein